MPGATSRPAVLLGAAALAGALAMTAAQAATFVYVGNAESNDIHVFTLDAKSGGAKENGGARCGIWHGLPPGSGWSADAFVPRDRVS